MVARYRPDRRLLKRRSNTKAGVEECKYADQAFSRCAGAVNQDVDGRVRIRHWDASPLFRNAVNSPIRHSEAES